MQFEERAAGSILIIKPMVERVEAANAGLFQEHLMARIRSGANRLVLDLSLVDFLDSSGLTALVAVFKALGKGQGGELVVVSLGPTLQSLLRMTGLENVIKSFAGPEEACQALGQGA